MLKAIFLDMDETLCGTSDADKLAGQAFARWVKITYPQLGDSLSSDIAGANQMGITSVWVDSTGNGNFGDITPSYTIRTFSELPAVLAAL